MTLRLLLAIWVGSPLTAAWMIPLPMTLSRERRHGTFSKANNIFDDEDCADLCEFDDIFEDTVSAEANNNSSGNEDTKIKSQEEPASEVDRDRLRLQMNWELRQTQEDCDVDDVQVVVHFAMNAWALELQNAVSAWETSMSSFQNGDKNLFVQFVIKVDTRYAENVVGVAGLPNGLNW
eukprot:CAMPEP_0194247804 /NCGR_PEP_ID=MMETSP0158-20130606/17130_1 /TAXON_ID=33649 /ORGANISM="Thalassionema nitzschioides, Strain L26-B" /LENGTH=177 /DNA_ID=CAMNT_0038983951 /DNA_START=170 /DNA_END=701 /DNA_ORIENTATION=-